MFWNIYSKRLLSCLRNKDQLIWIWAFPLILATLFYFTLSSVGEADNMKAIPTGVVTDAAYEADPMFSQVLDQVGSGENALLNITEYTGENEADRDLETGKIA